MIELSYTPNEESAMSFNIIVKDKNGDIVPLTNLTSVRWQLSDIDGVVINNRDFANGLVTENPITIYDQDLALTDSGPCRLIAIKVVYNSDVGQGITGTEEAKFEIDELTNIG